MVEIRLACRRLMARPGASLVSVLSLACSIGAAAATWSLISAVLLQPLPVRDSDTLVLLATREKRGARAGTVRDGFVYPDYLRVRDSGVFGGVAAVWLSPLPLPVDHHGLPTDTPVAFVSANLFELLGLRIAPGRGFTADDDRRGVPPVAILTDRYWRTTFNGDPTVVGRTISIGTKPVTIVGVSARGFRGLNLAQSPALFLPLETIGDLGPPSTNFFANPTHQSSPTAAIGIIGRLRSGQTIAQVIERLAAHRGFSGIGPEAPTFELTNVNTAAIPMTARAGMAQFSRLLGWTVLLLLLIGCATVAILLLVRTEARREEFAMCLALGASRIRLAAGIACEGALLAGLGALLALPVALWLFKAVGAFQLPGGINLGLLELTLDTKTIAVAAGSAALATVLVAMIAGVFGFRADVSDSLRARTGATPRVGRRRTRAALVAAQVALTLTLVAGTGLFARSLIAALTLNDRIDGSRILAGEVSLARRGYAPVRAATFFDALEGQLAGNPAIEAFSTSASGGGMGPGGRLTINGVAREVPSFVEFRWVDDTYLGTMRLPVRRGRNFAVSDQAGSPQVCIVSESLGRMMASGGDSLGRRITLMLGGKLDLEIVGVVDDVITNIQVAEPLALYMPLAQALSPPSSRTVTLRATGDPDLVRRELQAAVRGLDPELTPPPLLTLDERLLRQMAPQQFAMLVLGVLGTIAVLLTLLGTYVLAETMAVMRLREMGIRAALGATGRQLGAIVVRETAVLVGGGLGLGVLIAWVSASIVRGFLFRVQPLDPLTLGLVAVGILILAVGVSLRPAWRAARVDLASVLRAE